MLNSLAVDTLCTTLVLSIAHLQHELLLEAGSVGQAAAGLHAHAA
jgi:hypothetical protein